MICPMSSCTTTTSRCSIKHVKKHKLVLGSDLDECVLKNLYERQVRRYTLFKSALTLYQPDIVLKKKPRIYMVSDMLEHQQQNMLFSTQESLKRQSSTSVPFRHEQREEAKVAALGRQKTRARKAEQVLLMKGKGLRTREAPRQKEREKSIWIRRSSSVVLTTTE